VETVDFLIKFQCKERMYVWAATGDAYDV